VDAFLEQQRLVIHAAKTALAAALCWWLALRFGLQRRLLGLDQRHHRAAIGCGFDGKRIAGSPSGHTDRAVFAFRFRCLAVLPWNYILAVLAAVIVCGLLGLRNSSRLAGVTITLVMLVEKTGPRWSLALDRVSQVVLGHCGGAGGDHACFARSRAAQAPRWPGAGVPGAGALFEAILQGFLSAPDENLPVLRQDALAMLRGNNQLLDAARNEPSGVQAGAKG